MLTVSIVLKDATKNGEEKALHNIDIWNDGSGTHESGNYQYKIYTWRYEDRAEPTSVKFINGTVKDWPRLKKTALDLVQHILNINNS